MIQRKWFSEEDTPSKYSTYTKNHAEWNPKNIFTAKTKYNSKNKYCDSSSSSTEMPETTNENILYDRDYLNPSKLENTSNANQKKQIQWCRKLDFNEFDEPVQSSAPSDHLENKIKFWIDPNAPLSSSKPSSNQNIQSPNNRRSWFVIRRQSSNSFAWTFPKFDEEYIILKTLQNGEEGTSYLCVKIQNKQVYVVKETEHYSSKKDYMDMLDFVSIVKGKSNDPTSTFILNYSDFWIENESCEDRGMMDIDDDCYGVTSQNMKKQKYLYIVTNYCQNGDWETYLTKWRTFNFDFNDNFLWDVVFEMLCSVCYLHKIGFIHFDIKPRNFLVDQNGRILLTDFCWSKHNNSTKLGEEVEGDSVFWSPEWFHRRDAVTNKTDIFSLGLSILAVLTGVKLQKNGDIWQMIRTRGIPEEYYALIKSNKCDPVFINLIKVMTEINSVCRPEIESWLNDYTNYPKWSTRYFMLKNGQYKRTFNPSEWKEFMEGTSYDFNSVININDQFAKRSDSCKFVNY